MPGNRYLYHPGVVEVLHRYPGVHHHRTGGRRAQQQACKTIAGHGRRLQRVRSQGEGLREAVNSIGRSRIEVVDPCQAKVGAGFDDMAPVHDRHRGPQTVVPVAQVVAALVPQPAVYVDIDGRGTPGSCSWLAIDACKPSLAWSKP